MKERKERGSHPLLTTPQSTKDVCASRIMYPPKDRMAAMHGRREKPTAETCCERRASRRNPHSTTKTNPNKDRNTQISKVHMYAHLCARVLVLLSLCVAVNVNLLLQSKPRHWKELPPEEQVPAEKQEISE